MAKALTDADRKLLTTLLRDDILAPWSHPNLARLSRHGLVDQAMLVKPNGRTAISKRWSITAAGRALMEQPA
ncbi:MAG: hypothetical protein ACTHM0_13515 [Sphingomonas sp.]